MKAPWQLFWAGLDFINFFKWSYVISTTIAIGLSDLSPSGVFNVIVQCILILSFLPCGYFTFKKRKIGIWIYILQFPLRVYTFNFSFGIVYNLVFGWRPNDFLFPYSFAIPALEFIRLIYVARNFKHFHPVTVKSNSNDDLIDQ